MSGSDVTGVLAAAAGLVLIGLAAAIPWLHRGTGRWLGRALAVPAVAHRITLRPEMWVRKIQGSDVVEDLLRRLPVPRTGGGPQ